VWRVEREAGAKAEAEAMALMKRAEIFMIIKVFVRCYRDQLCLEARNDENLSNKIGSVL
jgi:hypothetical protein